jgi:hypothetical protein
MSKETYERAHRLQERMVVLASLVESLNTKSERQIIAELLRWPPEADLEIRELDTVAMQFKEKVIQLLLGRIRAIGQELDRL